MLLISEKIDTRAIIERAICTVSVSGTACYEAALAGKISLTFAPMFFNLLKGCYSLSLNELRECNNFYQLLDHLKDKYCNNQLDPVDFKKLLYSKTFKGEWSPHDNSNLEIENLNNLSDAIWYRHCIGITNINV